MKFKRNPFWLHPIKEEQIDELFINREKKLNRIESMLNTEFENPTIISAVIGGVGIGKSSLLTHIKKTAKESGKSVGLTKETSSPTKNIPALLKKKEVALIDDIDKVVDEKANKFYNMIENQLEEIDFVFFADTFEREKDTKENREFTATQAIMLPKGMSDEKLHSFLIERMKNCYSGKKDFHNPFEEKAIQLACLRSFGNLRTFFKYIQSAWWSKKDPEPVTVDNMKEGIVTQDKNKMYGFGQTEYKILWYSTKGEISKGYLKKKANDIHLDTLNKRLNGPLEEFVTVKTKGKKSQVSSIYSKLPGGKEILKRILRGLRVDIPEIHEEK